MTSQPDRAPGMDERPTKRRGPLGWLASRTRRFWIVVALVAALPAAYLLSAGPAFRQVVELRSVNQNGRADAIIAAYYPVTFVAERVEPFARLMNWYINLWV